MSLKEKLKHSTGPIDSVQTVYYHAWNKFKIAYTRQCEILGLTWRPKKGGQVLCCDNKVHVVAFYDPWSGNTYMSDTEEIFVYPYCCEKAPQETIVYDYEDEEF